MKSAAEQQDILTGTQVKLIPYVRGHMPPETLYTLWTLMKQEDALKRFFYPHAEGVPFPTKGDLVEFIKFFEPAPPVERALFIAVDVNDWTQLVGMFWLDEYVHRLRVNASTFYRRRYWGEVAREATALGARYCFEVLEVQSIYAYTCWPTGKGHAEAQGMRLVATLPDFISVDDRTRDLLILRVTRDEWEATHGQQ